MNTKSRTFTVNIKDRKLLERIEVEMERRRVIERNTHEPILTKRWNVIEEMLRLGLDTNDKKLKIE